jgi:hypothetical protein
MAQRREGGVRPAVGPERGGAGSSNMGAGVRYNRGGGPVWGNGQWAGPGKKKKKNGPGPR